MPTVDDARVHGWGPDYAEVRVYCPEGGNACPWYRIWDTDVEPVTLGDIKSAVRDHMLEVHP